MKEVIYRIWVMENYITDELRNEIAKIHNFIAT